MSDKQKTLSLWVQSVQIWQRSRKEAGLPQKIPRKGSDDHKEILAIMSELKDGKLSPDPTIKTTFTPKPPRSGPKKTKIPVYASTHRKGTTTKRGRQVNMERISAERKKAEKELAKGEADLRDAKSKFDSESDKMQAKMVMLLGKMQKGNKSDEELENLQAEIESLRLPIDKQKALIDKITSANKNHKDKIAELDKAKKEAEAAQAKAKKEVEEASAKVKEASA